MAKTEHCIDWRKTAGEIDADYAAAMEETERLRAVAQAADEMMAVLGYEGEIDTRHSKTQELLARLYDWRPECQSSLCPPRYRVKLNDAFGPTLSGHWFWLLPVDKFADKALREVVGLR